MAPGGEVVTHNRTWSGRIHDSRFILWWSIAWAIGTMALAPIVNFITPLLNPSYANAWTPDVYWRLVLYWHGMIFIPWITILAVVTVMKFNLFDTRGLPGRLVRESIYIGGFLAVPIAGVAGIFDVYDRFALGIPLWAQIGAFLIGDEMALALLAALLVYPRLHGGYRKAGLPYFTVFTGVFSALVAALMGHMGGWITWFGPSPQIFNQYINSTMYPVLNYYNSTAVITFTEDVVGSHSHLMLISLMAGVVALVAIAFGYENWSKNTKRVAGFGFAVMIVSLLTSIWIYVVSGVGNYAIPTFFVSGANGIAGDDLVTGAVGVGAFFVLLGLLAHSRRGVSSEGRPLFKDPFFLTVIAGWLIIYLVIPITGYYIELNELFYQASGLTFDTAFTRFHQDFAFFLLPALITLILALDAYRISGKSRRYSGYLLLAGVAIAYVFGELYSMVALNGAILGAAIFGGFLIGLGGLIGAIYLARPGRKSEGMTQEPSSS
jgi:hypothetical protein